MPPRFGVWPASAAHPKQGKHPIRTSNLQEISSTLAAGATTPQEGTRERPVRPVMPVHRLFLRVGICSSLALCDDVSSEAFLRGLIAAMISDLDPCGIADPATTL